MLKQLSYLKNSTLQYPSFWLVDFPSSWWGQRLHRVNFFRRINQSCLILVNPRTASPGHKATYTPIPSCPSFISGLHDFAWVSCGPEVASATQKEKSPVWLRVTLQFLLLNLKQVIWINHTPYHKFAAMSNRKTQKVKNMLHHLFWCWRDLSPVWGSEALRLRDTPIIFDLNQWIRFVFT